MMEERFFLITLGENEFWCKYSQKARTEEVEIVKGRSQTLKKKVSPVGLRCGWSVS